MRKMNMKCIIKLMLKMSTLRRIMKLKRLKRLHIMMISQNLIMINKEITKSIRKQAEATEEVEEVAKEEVIVVIVVVKVGHVETKVKEEVVVTIVGEVEDLPTKTMKALSSKLVVKRSNSVVIAEEEIVEIEVTEVTEVTGVTEVTDRQEVVEEIVQEEKEEAEVKAEVVTEVVRQVKLTTKLPLNLIGTS